MMERDPEFQSFCEGMGLSPFISPAASEQMLSPITNFLDGKFKNFYVGYQIGEINHRAASLLAEHRTATAHESTVSRGLGQDIDVAPINPDTVYFVAKNAKLVEISYSPVTKNTIEITTFDTANSKTTHISLSIQPNGLINYTQTIKSKNAPDEITSTADDKFTKMRLREIRSYFHGIKDALNLI